MSAMLERLTAVVVDTAQKRTADAALDTVEGACGIFRDEPGSWLSHA